MFVDLAWSDDIARHSRVRCIFLNVEKNKEGEIMLALDSSNM